MALKAKKQAPALEVPQDDAEANALLAEYGTAFNTLARMKADMDDALAKVKADHEALALPLQEQLNTHFKALEAYAAAHRKRLLGKDGGKTVKMASGEVGWRLRPAKVTFARGLKVEDIVANIKAAGLRRFLRVISEPNKEAMLADPDAARKIEGVKIGSAGETFFVVPFGAELAEPKT